MAKRLLEMDLGGGQKMLVETDAPQETQGRLVPASSAGGKIEEAAQSFDDVLARVRHMSEGLVTTLSDLAKAPDTVTVELGVKMGGKVGIILTEGTAEANLKLTLTWKNG